MLENPKERAVVQLHCRLIIDFLVKGGKESATLFPCFDVGSRAFLPQALIRSNMSCQIKTAN